MNLAKVAPLVVNVGEPVMTNDVPVPVMGAVSKRKLYALPAVAVAVKEPPDTVNVVAPLRGKDENAKFWALDVAPLGAAVAVTPVNENWQFVQLPVSRKTFTAFNDAVEVVVAMLPPTMARMMLVLAPVTTRFDLRVPA